MNETIHDEENSSEAEDDTSEEQNLNELQTYENNGEQNKQQDKLLTTNFEVKVKTEKLKGSKPVQLTNRYSNLRSILELTKKYGEFILIFNQFIVNGPLMPFNNIWVLCNNRKSKCDDEGKSQYTIF